MAKAYFGAGCFWHPESVFRKIPGVTDTAVGYQGGNKANPTYEQVCSGRTGHVEVVEVTYDPAKVSYDDLLKVFWKEHDPTQLNRQGPDIGEQYRSVVFTTTPEQEAAAKAAKAELQAKGVFPRPVVTEVQPAPEFWKAEDYHQQYLEKRGHRRFGFL